MIIRPIRGVDEFNNVVAQAKEDKHMLFAPTHLVVEKDEVRGALTYLPSVLVWADTRKNKIRDSIRMKEIYESQVAFNGGRTVIVPCHPASPYYKFMEADGYINLGYYTLFAKGL